MHLFLSYMPSKRSRLHEGHDSERGQFSRMKLSSQFPAKATYICIRGHEGKLSLEFIVSVNGDILNSESVRRALKA